MSQAPSTCDLDNLAKEAGECGTLTVVIHERHVQLDLHLVNHTPHVPRFIKEGVWRLVREPHSLLEHLVPVNVGHVVGAPEEQLQHLLLAVALPEGRF